jgi:hypothetical protein
VRLKLADHYLAVRRHHVVRDEILGGQFHRRSENCNQLKAVFPASSQTTRFWRFCRRSDYAEYTQDSVATPLLSPADSA